MAIGECQDENGSYLKQQALPLIHHPRSANTNTHNFYPSQLPLAPADSRHDQYLDPNTATRHDSFQSNGIPRAIDNISPAFDGLVFGEDRDRVRASGRATRALQIVSLHMQGSDDLSSVHLEWSQESSLLPDERNWLERSIRKLLQELTASRNGVLLSTPNRPTRVKSEYGSNSQSRRSSWSPDSAQRASQRFGQMSSRKRQASHQLSRDGTPEEDPEGEYYPGFQTQSSRQIVVGDQASVIAYFTEILRGIQQLALKQILKEWIKEIEPKKQKNCPYKKNVRPKWWPEEATYKEPDHIKVDDRVILAIGIIRHAQDPNELEGNGLQRLERVARRQELIFENEPQEKKHYREELLRNLFSLARAEQQVQNMERDATEVIALPEVKKFERLTKNKRKKSSVDRKHESKLEDIEEDAKPNRSLLNPEPLRSHGHERGMMTVPSTPTWSRPLASHDGTLGSVSYSQASDSTIQGHMYSHHYDPSSSIDTRYSSFDASNMDGSDSSPISQYPGSATSAGSMPLGYSSSSAPTSMTYQAPIHAMSMQQHNNDVIPDMILPSHRQQMVFSAVTDGEDGRWSATPAAFLPQQQQSMSFYG